MSKPYRLDKCCCWQIQIPQWQRPSLSTAGLKSDDRWNHGEIEANMSGQCDEIMITIMQWNSFIEPSGDKRKQFPAAVWTTTIRSETWKYILPREKDDFYNGVVPDLCITAHISDLLSELKCLMLFLSSVVPNDSSFPWLEKKTTDPIRDL